MTLYALMHNDWWMAFVGLCALAVLFALMRNIGKQKPDILPPPRCDLIARGGHDHWRVSDAKDLIVGK